MTFTGVLSQIGLGVALDAADMDAATISERYGLIEREAIPAIVESHRGPSPHRSFHLPPHLQIRNRPLAANTGVRLLRDPVSAPTTEGSNPWLQASTLLGAGALFLPSGKRKSQNREETIAQLFTEYEEAARARLGKRPDARIVTPWDPDISAETRASWLRHIMRETYWDNGSAVLLEPFSASVEKQRSKALLTWFMVVDGQPVSTSSLAISNGNAVMCFAASIPKNGHFPDGTPVHGREKVPGSAVQYTRMAQFLRRPEVKDVWGFDSYLRLGVEFPAPGGKMIQSGLRTQHINGRPYRFLLCQPLYHKDIGRVEFRVVTRLFLEPNAVRWDEPLYTPTTNPYNSLEPTQAEIATLTYSLAGTQAQIVDRMVGRSRVLPTVSLVYQDVYTTMVKFDGNWTLQALTDCLAGYQESGAPNVEIVVENKPENIELQRKLLEIGAIALGVKPGGKFTLGDGEEKDVPTLFHFSLATRGYDPVNIELADEYVGTPMEDMAKRVHTVWRNRLLPSPG